MNSMGLLNDAKLFHTILDNLREGINVVDTNGYLTYCNKSSARYVLSTPAEMLGKPITDFYPRAVLKEVLKTRKPLLDYKITHNNGRTFVVNAEPLYLNDTFSGAVATFRDITEIEELSRTLESLQIELVLSQSDAIFDGIVGWNGSLKECIEKAQRSIASLGGPRHSIILGETGTGKTMLAKAIYLFAKKLKVIKEDAPFVDINCAQFTNADMAAMEIFGTEKGAFTGSVDKPGLVEVVNGGVLFLDEAHALVQHQTMLLKLIESGSVRRIGGRFERKVSVIIIAASSKDLQKEFLPELYQRLAQYQIELPPLRDRSGDEKKDLINCFVNQYVQNVKMRHNLCLEVNFTPEALHFLLNATYERNIRQLRDIINESIDNAAPTVDMIQDLGPKLVITVEQKNVPGQLIKSNTISIEEGTNENLDSTISQLSQAGLGPRKIAAKLVQMGYQIKYYQVAYRLQKLKNQVD
jgi:PAS domain S-box